MRNEKHVARPFDDFAGVVAAQEAAVAPPESLVVAGVPKIPLKLAETAGRYGAFRKCQRSEANQDYQFYASVEFLQEFLLK